MQTPATPPADQVPQVFSTLTHFGAIDWGRGAHELCIVDAAGAVVLRQGIDNAPETWADLRSKVAQMKSADGSAAVVGFAIETCNGPAVERLLEAKWPVFPLNPKAAERYRDRKAPSGCKDDGLDAFCFADALRTDGHGWRPLRPQDLLTHELRLLCRDETTLIAQRTALVNQLQAALYEYYPTAIAAFDDWTGRGAWEFVLAFPTPHQLASAGKRKWERFLHAHKLYRPETTAKRIELFNVARKHASPNDAVTSAKSLLATALVRQLLTLQDQLDEYRRQINRLFASHPDHDLFGSLPGAGEKLAPRLLAEMGADREVFQSPEALQRYSGAAPITRRSGKSHYVLIRRACNMHLRTAIHLWANLSRVKAPWAEAYYQEKRQRGMSHPAALRCLAMRWLKILWKMWADRTRYDGERHLRDQLKHGSWVIAMMPQPVVQSN
ncbi:MAG TPA: IS110 family transposase [Tepidisphaeraceae bacterium]|jgi:transposase|nr:IS110 family transposase [Tepidisphaeraceae bacterium]